MKYVRGSHDDAGLVGFIDAAGFDALQQDILALFPGSSRNR
jgi:hypothetical protein